MNNFSFSTLFLAPELLWHVLWIIPSMCMGYLRTQKRRSGVLNSLLGGRVEELSSVSYSRRKMRFLLELAIVICLVVSAARPHWGARPRSVTGQGRSIVFLVDVSRSMLAEDVKPSRLSHVRWSISSLANSMATERFSLISFAGVAFLECPLTADLLSFEQAVADFSTETMPVGGTNIENALQAGIRALNGCDPRSSALVLMTDGGELDGDSLKAVQEVQHLGISLIVVGVGVPGQQAVIPFEENGAVRYVRDKQGEIVKCGLDESRLSDLAKQGGGVYVTANTLDDQLDTIRAALAGLGMTSYEAGSHTLPIERTYVPLTVAFILLLLWLSSNEVKPMVAAAVIGFLTVNVSAQDEAFSEAARSVRNNLHDKAFDQYSALIESADSEEVRCKAYFNLGSLLHRRGQDLLALIDGSESVDRDQLRKCGGTLSFALDMYKAALSFDVELEYAAKNITLLQRSLEELEAIEAKVRKNTQKPESPEADSSDAQPDDSGKAEKAEEKPEVSHKESADIAGGDQKNDEEDDAEALLKAVIDDEADMRRELKQQQRKEYGVRRVERDW